MPELKAILRETPSKLNTIRERSYSNVAEITKKDKNFSLRKHSAFQGYFKKFNYEDIMES